MATSIRLAIETKKRLDILATQTGRTKAFYLREMIERGIEELEDYIWPPTCWSGCTKVMKRCIPLDRQDNILAWTINTS